MQWTRAAPAQVHQHPFPCVWTRVSYFSRRSELNPKGVEFPSGFPYAHMMQPQSGASAQFNVVGNANEILFSSLYLGYISLRMRLGCAIFLWKALWANKEHKTDGFCLVIWSLRNYLCFVETGNHIHLLTHRPTCTVMTHCSEILSLCVQMARWAWTLCHLPTLWALSPPPPLWKPCPHTPYK